MGESLNRRLPATALHLLTARQVQAVKEGDHGDGGGLLLRVRGQSASWVFKFTSPAGKRREMGLGVAPRGSTAQAGATLTAARDMAHKARELLRNGTDPIDAREQAREAARGAQDAKKAEKARERWTLARCARDYHERVIEPTRTTKHAAQYINSLENHVPAALWHAPVADIKAPELLRALLAVKPHEKARNLTSGDKVPETVQRIRQRLDAVFEDAIFHGRATANPAAAVKRKLTEGAPLRVRGQFKALPYRDAPAFMARLRAAPGTAARCLELAVLTASRTAEALLAQWGEVDLLAGTWLLPKSRMKAGEPHLVPLSPRALAVLSGQVGQHARWVFPSTMKGYEDKPQSNMAGERQAACPVKRHSAWPVGRG